MCPIQKKKKKRTSHSSSVPRSEREEKKEEMNSARKHHGVKCSAFFALYLSIEVSSKTLQSNKFKY